MERPKDPKSRQRQNAVPRHNARRRPAGRSRHLPAIYHTLRIEMTPPMTSQPYKSLCIDTNSVLVANDVNLSIFTAIWLTREAILTESEIGSNAIFTPGLIQIPTPDFNLLILGDRIQVGLPPSHPNAAAILLRLLGGVLSKLPHTPYTAFGINFTYLLAPSAPTDFGKWNRSLFRCPVADDANGPDDRFGSYQSTNLLGMRAKIDIKPVQVHSDVAKTNQEFALDEEAVAIQFNFHYSVTTNTPANTILPLLSRLPEAQKEAERFVAKLGQVKYE